jgi:hypothetical protein
MVVREGRSIVDQTQKKILRRLAGDLQSFFNSKVGKAALERLRSQQRILLLDANHSGGGNVFITGYVLYWRGFARMQAQKSMQRGDLEALKQSIRGTLKAERISPRELLEGVAESCGFDEKQLEELVASCKSLADPHAALMHFVDMNATAH